MEISNGLANLVFFSFLEGKKLEYANKFVVSVGS